MKSWKKSITLAMVMFFICVSLALAGAASDVSVSGGSGSGGSVGNIDINKILVRQIVTEQVRQLVSRTGSSLYNNQNSYYASSSVNADGWSDLIIEDPAPGAYTSYIYGQVKNEQTGEYVTRLESRNEVVIGKGKNKFTPELILADWQDVVIKLPAKYEGGAENFNASFMRPEGKSGTSFHLTPDRQYIYGMISISATSDISIIYNDRKYAIPLAYFFGAIGENNAMALESFKSEEVTSATIAASVMQNIIEVPTEAPNFTEAMKFATAGMTVLAKCGHYNESFKMKPGVRLMGYSPNPECVVIESDQYSTIYGEKGTYEIVGVTIINTNTDERYYRAGAVMIERASVKMRHVIIKSTGTRAAMSPSESILDFGNVTLVGNGSNQPFDSQPLEKGDSLKNLLLYNFARPYQYTEKATISNSLFWQTPLMADDGSNVTGDPQFLQNWSSGVRPNINSPAVQQIMNQSGNYPGALRPENPY